MKTFTMLLLLAGSVPAAAQNVTEIRYELRFDSATAKQRTLEVTTTFRVAAATPVLLSLPSWTPGSYEVANFARHVRDFSARQNGAEPGLGQERLRHVAGAARGRGPGRGPVLLLRR